jgi:4-aminobutyrate--pyruvate transaminase
VEIRLNSSEARDIAFSLHPYTNLSRHEVEGPLVISRGRGIYVYDEAGTEFLEAVAGLWSASLGFGGEERLVEAVAAQLRTLPFYHLFAHKAHLPGIDLAEKIIGMLPVAMSKVFFNNSGSEANDTAIKFVRYYNNAIGRPKKKKIIAQLKGYHGVTVATASLTGLARNHADFDLPIEGIRHSDCPHFYRFGKPGESEEEFATRLAENLEALILRENPDTVAAFIAEPVQGAGGLIVPPRTYFDKIQPILKKYDILFIADEVICGFGRLGTMFGIESFGIKPDIITLAKALSASYLPISATVISQALYDAMRDNSDKLGTFAHGYTYSGHPVCAAVALETLRIYEERKIVEHVRSVAPAFQAGVRRFVDHPLVGEVRGMGLLAGVEFVANKKSKTPFEPKLGVGALFQKQAQRHGLIVRALGDTVALSPPLIIDEVQIEELFRRFERALKATAAEMTATT